MTSFAPGTPQEVIDGVNNSLGMSSPSSVNTTTTADVMGGSNPATTRPFAELLAQLFSKKEFGPAINSYAEKNYAFEPAITNFDPAPDEMSQQPTLGMMPPPPKSDDGSGGYKAVRAETPSVGGAYSDAQNGGMKSFDQFKDDFFAAENVIPQGMIEGQKMLQDEYDKYKSGFNNPATPSSGATQPTSAQGPSLDYLGQMLSGGLGGYGMYQPQPQRGMFGGFGMPMMQPMYGMGMGLGLGGYGGYGGGYGGMSPYGGMGYGGFGGYGGYGGGMSPFGMGLGGYGGYGGGMPYGNMYGGGFYNTMPQQGYTQQPQVANTQSFAFESPYGAGSLFGSLGFGSLGSIAR
jgi:hypothetical protein